MELLLASVAGCMAIDVRMILEKARVPLAGLEVDMEGARAATEPRRYTRIRMHFRLTGPSAADDDRIARAIQLSREKYCSVMHTLAPDLPVETSFERLPVPATADE